jgi:hypothetical protein
VIKDIVGRAQVDDWQVCTKVMWYSKSWVPTMDGEGNNVITFIDFVVASL